MGEATRCPTCGRPMIWGGSRCNNLTCTTCDAPKSMHFDGRATKPEESITDLLNRGVCYCHLMIGRVCKVCVAKGPKP